MSVQENSSIVEELFAAVNAHDVGRYLELFSDDVVMRSTLSPEPVRSKDIAGQQLVGYFTTFPDYHIELKNAVVADDQFTAELEFSGTHEGPFSRGPEAPPFPPTGAKVRTRGIFVADVKNGKIVEMRQYPDGLGMMMQLGLVSPPGSG